MAEKTIRIGLIGAGFMGRAHSNAFRQVKRFFDVPFSLQCKVICGRSRANLEKAAAAWEWEETATDWRAVVDRSDIDLIDIAVPNALHAPIAIAAAQRGKIVFCEKPLAVSAEEGARMLQAARDVPNMVWYNYRRVPAVAFARQLIEEGRLGHVYHYRAAYLQQWGNDPTRPPGWKLEKQHAGSGVLGDLLSHLVDLALYLNGPIRELSGTLHTFADGRDVDDAAGMLARFENGSLGSLETSRYAVGCRNRNAFQIHGSLGMLAFDLEDMNHLEYYDASEAGSLQGVRRLLITGPDHPYSARFWKPGHIIGYEHTFIAALGDFLEALAQEPDGWRRFHPNFEDGQRVEMVLGAVERSARLRQWVEVQ